MCVLIFIDIFWLLIMGFVWEHDEKDTEYWKELTTLHSLVRCGVWGEVLLSCAILGLLFWDYKQTYGKYLNPLDLKYEKSDPMLNY